MKLDELVKRLDADLIVNIETTEVDEFYAGDFLSRVIGKAPSGCAWFTIMNNINVAGVATLSEVKAIVMCEGVMPIDTLVEKCKECEIAILVTKLDVYNACIKTVL